ncbi:MHC class II transactivator isoform X1 [Heterocephalus glaber]|uniref:MHC class II transactivator n=1 Tax=Heterocephalus glaber TaxID=10181 RepID=A0AAX6RQ66_HETGA|nr:MHC class II transactivator isoform X1 [Heterocephalus glaber]XP_021099958.1 MHC class II transactivator isoform X1 [Heterocephalus glaber]XP_021099959.1 MHC class II transactivator isoform X1 [Heterocephalus glaber]
MELGPLEGGYLELLNSDVDPLHLYHFYDQMDLAGEEEIELCSEPDMDTINCDQFSRLLCDMEGDEETREAYANIAELDQYVFQDAQLEDPSKDIFIEHIELEEVIGESVEVLEEAGQRSQKRSFPEEHPLDLKHRKLAEPLSGPIVTGSFLVGLASGSSPLSCQPPHALFKQMPGPAQTRLEEAVQGPADPSTSLVGCVTLPAGPIQLISTFPTLPQGLWQVSGLGTGISSILIYHGEVPLASHTLPSSGPAVHSLPKSPGRPGSTSPFAPSAADLPSMPEPALTSRTDMTGVERSPSPCQAAAEDVIQLPKWPETVRQFYHSLQDWHQAETAGLEGVMVEVELLRARLEKGSHKSQERELATVDWAERQPASGGLAQVLLAASDRRRPLETRVIAVLGKAGQGKSHWARAVGRAWACGQLPKYDFVFYVPCYCLDHPGDTYRLQDLLWSPGPQPLAMDDEVFSHISRRPDRVLLILDAFEELEAQDGFLHGAGGPACTEPCSLRGLLAGLLQRRLLRGCTLLLTAQPRGRLAQVLGKADALFEVAGFSTEQAQTYVKCYFEGSEYHERALMLLQNQPFLLSHSHSPTLCRAVCQLSETLLQRGEEAELPSTLTGLYVGLLAPVTQDSPPGALAGLAKLAWELGRKHQSVLREGQFPSEQVRTWAVTKGLVQPVAQQVPGAAQAELVFSSFLLQCFLGALWLALSSEIKDKELPQFLALTPRKKRPYDNWMEGVPRFLAGLIFQPRARCLGALVGSAAASAADRKQKVLTRYLKRLQPRTLQAGRLLELLHCAHEAREAGIWTHVARELPSPLSFLGTRLTPPDAHVLGQALQAADRDFSLDLRSTGIEPLGLGSLVGLSCVTSFRAALSDTVGLWESLQQRGETQLLQAVEEKFTIEPFKAKSLKDVEDLGNLVQTQRLRSSSKDTVWELPAVRDLKKLEFALGPTLGPQAFPKLARILPAFSSLQHLDLDSLSENKIGDKGVSELSATFPQLKALETLNLSQNSITDVGACKLAEALPSLSASLLRLSLYNNCICDAGAESLARALPEMGSLRVIDVQYNKFTAVGAQQLAASLRKCPYVETLA